MLGDILLWYLWVQAFALGGWLIASRWLAGLPDRGYGISKVVGLVVGGFAYWAGVTSGFSSNHGGAALLGLVAVWLAGFWLRGAPAQHLPLLPYIACAELLFGLAFVGWSAVRAYSPEITSAGGEKFMEAMMINAILRSPSFPPHDAWLAGYSLSYYYFGYLIFAMLILLSGVPSAVGFNLGGALTFALTVVSAFSLGYNLRAGLGPDGRASRASIATGLLTAAMLALMGNLGGALGLLKCADALPTAFWAWLDVRETAARSYACDGLIPREFYGWWWDWSRVVKDTTPDGRYQETITEFPIFSFVLGDNHPHVMGLPLALLALSLAFAALRSRGSQLTPAQSAARLVLTAITLGALGFMNTWDWPIYSAIFIVASLLGSAQRWRTLAWIAGALALGYALYLPWQVTFASQASGIGVNLLNGTRLTHFGLLFAPFLVAGLGFLLWATKAARTPAHAVIGHAAGLTGLTLAALIIGAAAISLLSPQGRALIAEWQTTGTALGYPSELVAQRLIARATAPWTSVLLAGIAAWCAVLLVNYLARRLTGGLLCLSDAFALILLGAGALLTLAVEFVFLRDLFGTRMNTVFKFYYQAWTLWAIAGGYAIARILIAPSVIGRAFGTAALVCVILGMCYPPMVIYARSNGFRSTPTLDGTEYLRTQQPEDAALIAWLNANIQGAPRILEAPPDDAFGAYAYEGRIATFTGLPTILGWGGHQHQWRGRTDIQAERFPLIEQLYNTPDPTEARALLHQLEVRHVVVGQVERARFAPDGLDKFEAICKSAFRTGKSAVYHCPTP
jgi:YYY domain-containing protein